MPSQVTALFAHSSDPQCVHARSPVSWLWGALQATLTLALVSQPPKLCLCSCSELPLSKPHTEALVSCSSQFQQHPQWCSVLFCALDFLPNTHLPVWACVYPLAYPTTRHKSLQLCIFQFMNIVYFSIYLIVLWCLLLKYYNFLYKYFTYCLNIYS